MTPSQRIKLSASLLLVCFTASITIFSQTVVNIDSPSVAGTSTVIAGYHFKRSGYHNLFWGKHYRREWTTTARVKNFYLDTAAGGLTPVKEGGSRQSKGLHLKNKQGKEYVLRSIDKDFGNGLGDKFKGTFIDHIAKDQSSIGHPYAATTVAAMIAPTGIYHANPQIVFVPKQPLLGEYNTEYGDQLYLFEERPDENEENAPWFGNSKNVIGTEKMFEHIYEDNDNHVDQKAFAKARLFDVFIGDWGRHPDQWRWAEFENGKETIYKPIPRDRDQAYTQFDGFWPWVATNIGGPGSFLENFDKHLNSAEKFNLPGRPLDKNLLNQLTNEEWITIARELQSSLTDAVIENGVRQMPAEIFAISGEKIITALKSRRDDLQKSATEFYKYLAKDVTILGSQKTEHFVITRINDNETRVDVYKKTKEGEIKEEPYYSRVFKKSETKKIYLYSLEGKDDFKMTGSGGVDIIIIDPDKSDSFDLQNKSKTSISVGRRFEYDTLDHSKLDFSLRPINPSEYNTFDNDPIQLFTRLGLKVCASFTLVPKPWQKAEYQNQHLIAVSWGYLRGTVAAGYIGTFKQAVGKWDLVVKARADIPAIENFYGVGNESPNNKITNTFYIASSTRLFGGIGLSRDMGVHHFEVTPFYQNVKTNRNGDRFVTGLFDDQSVFTAKQFAGVETGYELKMTNDDVYPTKGVHFILGAGYVQNIRETSRSFIKGASSLAFYIPLGKSFSLAFRGGGGIISGDADYYHLNTLGGNKNLRGYPRDRFFGKSSFYSNNELRWIFNTHNYLFTGRMGLLAFYDNGRVWQPGEVSNTWHPGYGGGLIVIPFNKVALTGTYGRSRETTNIILQASVFF